MARKSRERAAPEAVRNPGDEAAPATPGTGEDRCGRCRGTGRCDGRRCPDCGGTGRVVKGIGGA
jgi:hypothetical protein